MSGKIDLSMLRQISFGDDKIMYQLLESAANDLLDFTTQLQLLKDVDNPQWFDVIHKLKTTMIMVGAQGGILKSQKILDAIQNSSNNFQFDEYLQELINEVQLVESEIRQRLP